MPSFFMLIQGRSVLMKEHLHRHKAAGKEGGTGVRISSSNVDMYSDRTYSSQSYESETTQVVTEPNLIRMIKLEPKAASGKNEAVKSEVAETILEKEVTQNGEAEADAKEAEETEGENVEKETKDTYHVPLYIGKVATSQQIKDRQTIRQQCIQYILEMLLLNKERRANHQGVKRTSFQDWLKEKENRNSSTTTTVSYNQNGFTSSGKYTVGEKRDMGDFTGTFMGYVNAGTKTAIRGSKTEYYSEKERTSYQTKGTVVTADGKEIEFNLSFAMSRGFEQYYNENYEKNVVSFCDPLVINLDSTMPTVSDEKFLFDIDGDGVLDTISKLSNKSGYLAIDKNGDGQINDGNELFGTKSGNGFADLAEYDSDGNGWIDEGDEIWDKLMIWCMDENGRTELYHVSEKGIGAICLQNVSSDFSLNSLKTNQTNAAVRNTGIFLYENGGVGTVQHMDLAI